MNGQWRFVYWGVLVGVVLTVVVVFPVSGSEFYQATNTPVPTIAPTATNFPLGTAPAETVVTVPVLWGGAMPVVYVILVALLAYWLYRIITGFIPGS